MSIFNSQKQTPTHKQGYFSKEMNLFYWSKLKVADIMSREVVTVSPQKTTQQAALIMADKQISCVLVTTDNQVVGILSQKDMIASAHMNGPSKNVHVASAMSQPVKTVEPQTPLLHAGMLMDKMGFKRLPVVSNRDLMGIITQTDLVQAFESMSALRNITEIMTEDIVTIAPDKSVAQALDIMVQRGISSVLIVRQNGRAEGILTEKDVLRMVLAQGADPHQIQLVDVMSFPLITVPTTYSILSASRLMYDKHLHRLVVTDEQGVCGIVTRTDILSGYQTCAQSETQQELHMLSQCEDAIFLLDAEGTTTFVNPAFLRLFQTDSPELFMDRPFPPDELWVNPEDKYSFEMERGLDVGGIESLLLRTASGECLSARLCLGTIKDVSGKMIGKRGVIWDLTRDPL